MVLLLPLPMACYENNRHESINAGMSFLTIIIVVAYVLHTVGFKFYKFSLFMYLESFYIQTSTISVIRVTLSKTFRMSGKWNILGCKVNHAVNDWVNAVIVCICVETRVERVTRLCVPIIQCWTLIILLSKLSLNSWSFFSLIILAILTRSWVMHSVVR